MQEDEVEAGVTVPAVPDGEAVEADEILDDGEPREQEHLQQRRVRPEEARDSGGAREELSGRQIVGQVASVHPEPDERCGIPGDERPEQSHCGGPARRARPEQGEPR